MNPLSPDQLRQLAEPLAHPTDEQQRAWAQAVADFVLEHWRSLPEQAIGQSASRARLEALLRQPPPELGQDFREVLAEFAEKVAAHAFRINHPRFFAFVPAAPSLPSMLGDWLCAGTNFFAGVWLEAAGVAQVELLVLDWFKEWLDCPPETQGVLTGGGSEANLIALTVARDELPFADRARAVLYVSEQRHWSVDRAARIIGLHPDQIRGIPIDAAFRLRPAALAELVASDRAAGRLPWAVVANAGATNTGAVDPLMLLADLCAEQALWLHVDAAYGWPAVLIPEGRQELAGIGRADSITLDPHKWFAQTYEAGCVLIREGRRLTDSFALRPDYMQDVLPGAGEVNFADHGIALTRRFRALKIWLSVKVLGLGWFRALIDRGCRLADFAESLLRDSPEFQVLCPRHLSTLCFRLLPPNVDFSESELNALNLALVESLRLTGRAFLSSTLLHGRVALRLCFVNWRTTARDVEETIVLLARLGRDLLAEGGAEHPR
jgi:glutamate/tyrosine decarboxylase-like PLP-dependent enzyme